MSLEDLKHQRDAFEQKKTDAKMQYAHDSDYVKYKALERHYEDEIAKIEAQIALLEARQSSSAARVEPAPGSMIRDYRLVRPLGEGGNGAVWLVEQALPDGSAIQRAMKLLHPSISADPVRVQRFREEIGVAARLGEASRSLHILPVYSWDPDGTFVVMKYVPGDTLRKRMDGKVHTLDEALIYLEPLARALDDAHSQGVIHRDVKPENVLIGERLYLADFGLAVSPTRGDDRLTRPGERPGTGRYMAPEQWREQTLNIQTDLYALAIIAYELLTGHLPFIADNDQDRGEMHCHQELPEDTKLPPEMLAVLQRGAAKRSEDRYASAGEFVHQLKNWAEGAETLYARTREYTEYIYYAIEKQIYAQFVDLSGDERTLTPLPVRPKAPVFDLLPIYDNISAPVTADYVEARHEGQKVHVEKVRERLLDIQRGVLLGEPGAGKTWMLLRTAYEAIRRWRNDPDHAPIPVIVALNRFNGEVPFAAHVRQSLRMLAPYANQLKHDRRLLLLCDALNEMPQKFVADVVEELKQQGRFIVSCRVRDYTEQLKDLHPLEQVYLHDLDLPGIEALITKRLPGEAGQQLWQRMGGSEELRIFWDKVQANGERKLFWQPTAEWDYQKYKRIPTEWSMMQRGTGLIPLARSPYMGHLLCQVYQESQWNLPRNRAELFKRFIGTLIERETKTAERIGRPFPPASEIEAALVALARALQEAKRTVIAEADALRAIRQGQTAVSAEALLKAAVDANILNSDGDGLKFSHQLLQEYFAARILLDAMEAGTGPSQFFGQTWWDAGVWRETIVILGEVLGEDTRGPNRVMRWLAPVTPDVALRVITRHGAGYTLADLEWDTKAALIAGAVAHSHEPDSRGRAAAYRALGMLNADDRPGIGLRADGLPDIEWVTIPDNGEWIYQERKHPGLPAFQISKYPITYAQYQAFIDDPKGFRDDRWWKGLAMSANHNSEPGEQRFKYSNHPRESVSWYDAMAFCWWLSWRVTGVDEGLEWVERWAVRLPTEQEWEKAARGREGWEYPYGNEFDVTKGNTRETGIGQTSTVGIFPQGASPYGVEEMSGNVWEWCLSDYANPAPLAEEENMRSSTRRVVRGGSWDFNSVVARTVFRNGDDPDVRSRLLGFRVVAPLLSESLDTEGGLP